MIIGGLANCSSDAYVNVIVNSGSWWQVVDGVVVTNGGITSNVANPNNFMLDGVGEYPGVPIYGGSFNLSGTNVVSSTRWEANTQTTTTRPFDYNYFEGLIPSDYTSGFIDSDFYEWYMLGPTTLTTTNYNNRKVVMFVDGDLTINGNLNVTDGQGFLGIFVSGDIIIDPAVTQLEGVYLTDGNFSTGAGTTALNTRGSIVSYGTMNLERSLLDNSDPAEIFTFAPDQLLLFPEKLMFTRNSWTEVAP